MADEKLSSRELSKKLTADYYEGLRTAKERGKVVAWASSIVPEEFMEAMDIEVAYPENHAASIAAKKGAIPMLEKAESMGYSNDLCSYARINLGYASLMQSDILNLPRPDFVVCINNICNVLIKWYENLAKYFHVPFLLIDVPFNTEYEVSEDRIEYVKGQFQEFIHQLEKICGRPFNYDKFNEVMKISQKSVRAWKRAMSYAYRVPSPLNGFNIFNYMALIVCLRGRKEAELLFNTIADEMEELIKEGKSQFKVEEKHRIMWEGIAVWPYLRHTSGTLKNYNTNLTGSTYPDAWALVYEPGDLDGMARAYASVMNNCCMARQVDLRRDIIRDAKCDGVVYHMNRSCKMMDFMQAEMRRQVFDKTQKPYAVFDGDQSDPRNYTEAQYETRIEALAESMSESKKERGNR